MLKRRSKHFALLLVLAMLATMFVGVGTASALSNYTVLATPTVLTNQTTDIAVNYQGLGTIQIDIPSLEVKQQTLLVTLPANFKYGQTPATGPVVSYVKDGGSVGAGSLGLVAGTAGVTNNGIIRVSDREFKVDFTPTAAMYDLRLTVSMPKVLIPDSAEGDIKATLTALNGNFSSGEAVVGKATSAGTVTAYINDTVKFGNAGTTATEIEINIKESTTNAIKGSVASPETSSIKIKLPKGMSWQGVGTITNLNTGVASADLTPTLPDARTLAIGRNAQTETKGVFRISNGINVDESLASYGKVEVTIAGVSSISPSTLEIGEYTDYGVTAVVKGDVPNVKAGRLAVEIADFNIEETAKGSILTNRSITLELPAGAKWATVPAPGATGSLTAGAMAAVGTDGRKVKFTATNGGTAKGKYTFENVEVDLAVDFSGDLKVKASGAGLEATELVLAKVAPALTAVADGCEVKIGVQSQDAGTIKITEGYKEALINAKNLTLTLPVGVNWAALPTVKVSEGDLDVDENGVSRNNNVLTIPVNAQSLIASTIEISNIKLTVDRTVPEGPMEVKIQGDAIDEVNDGTGGTVYTFYTANAAGIFPQNTVAAKAIGAKVVTPAPGETKNDTSFVIGAASYKINGVEKAMDVAPYIKDSRTYMPIRYVAYALGIADANILWDGTNQTVTLMSGDKVVQLKVGSKAIVINGASVTMDVAPEISNSRTMLPVSFVANAFGATASWDAATQTVTIK